MLTVHLDGNPARPISATKGEHKLEAEGGDGQAAEGQEPSHRKLSVLWPGDANKSHLVARTHRGFAMSLYYVPARVSSSLIFTTAQEVQMRRQQPRGAGI